MTELSPEERRADTYADQNGSYFLAGYHEDEVATAPVIDQKNRRKVSPTGRHRVEPSGGDISRMEANRDAIENPLTKEKREEIKRGMGHAYFLLEKSRLEYETMLRKAEDNPQMLAVQLRKLAEDIK